MVVVALCTPIAMMLLLLGMDAFEELLSRWSTDPDEEQPEP
ncbi:hypothetical protein [Streptomyces sp. NRRL S-340]|nr:hypothetical protein [Streptomyces sp. NRRL S-340]